MITDPGPWVKFWWKGVDILADVIKSLVTAAIVAVAAYLTWDQKKKLELRHDKALKLQTEELEKQFAADRAHRERISSREEKIRRWKAERADLLNRFPTQEEMATRTLRERYEEWLETNRLIAFGSNLESVRRSHFETFRKFTDAGGDDDLESIARFRKQIADTDLPKPGDDTFLW